MMFSELRVDLASLQDLATALDAENQQLQENAKIIVEAKFKLLQSTAGLASSAAVAQMDSVTNQMQIRAGKLGRNATVIRELATLYDEADLKGARSFGS